MQIGLQLVLSLLLLVVACREPPDTKKQTQVTAKSIEKKPSESLVSRTFEQRQKEEYKTQLKALRDGYLKSTEDLKARAQKSGIEVTDELQSAFAEVEEKTQTVDKILEKLDAASLESWQDLKPDIYVALNHLEWSYYKAVSQVTDLDEQQQAINRRAPPKAVTSLKAEDR